VSICRFDKPRCALARWNGLIAPRATAPRGDPPSSWPGLRRAVRGHRRGAIDVGIRAIDHRSLGRDLWSVEDAVLLRRPPGGEAHEAGAENQEGDGSDCERPDLSAGERRLGGRREVGAASGEPCGSVRA
jgi:hypothetical protein